MAKRPALPGADELFRRTASPLRPDARPLSAVPDTEVDLSNQATEQIENSEVVEAPVAIEGGVRPVTAAPRRRRGSSRPTGRVRHEEKITVYVSPEELIELEHARLALRGTHGLAVDRGRIVREAIAVVVADLEARGSDSIIVRRLLGL
jgi:hypothetical protein